MSEKVSARVIFLAVVAAIGGILFGYDTAVISGTTEVVKMQFGLSTGGEGWYVGCALIGSILGVLIAGMLSDFLGRKKTMLISAVLFSISAIGCALCADFTQLVIFRMIGGFGIGIVSIVSPIYISEVSPAKVRGTMVSLYQLFITIGFLLAYLMNYLIIKGTTLDEYWPRCSSNPLKCSSSEKTNTKRPNPPTNLWSTSFCPTIINNHKTPLP